MRDSKVALALFARGSSSAGERARQAALAPRGRDRFKGATAVGPVVPAADSFPVGGATVSGAVVVVAALAGVSWFELLKRTRRTGGRA